MHLPKEYKLALIVALIIFVCCVAVIFYSRGWEYGFREGRFLPVYECLKICKYPKVVI